MCCISSGTYLKPGLFKCEREDNYLLANQVCDGQAQCKYGDDEQICGIHCPDACDCVGFFYNCSLQNLQDDTLYTEMSPFARKIDLSHNNISYLTPLRQEKFIWMIEMIIAYNEIGQLVENNIIPEEIAPKIKYLIPASAE